MIPRAARASLGGGTPFASLLTLALTLACGSSESGGTSPSENDPGDDTSGSGGSADPGSSGAGGPGGADGAGGSGASGSVSYKGPLAGLPSAPGPHIDKINALGDGEWIDLGAPQADPSWGVARGRSWGGRALISSPDLRGAFFYGEGAHAFVKPDGHIMDDLWVYDINAHRWIAVYPGTDTTTFTQQVKDGSLLMNDLGQLVDANAEPVPVHTLIHAWDLLSYDPFEHSFAFLAGNGLGTYYLGGMELMGEGVALLEAQAAGKTAPPMSPWFYDTMEGRFEHHPIAAGPPDVGGYPNFQYVKSRKQYFLGGDGGVAFFDPATSEWTTVADQGPRPPGYDHGGCYDEKRDRIYMGPGTDDPTGSLYIYDLDLATWTKPTPQGPFPLSFRTNDASIFYDVANDVVTIFRYNEMKIFTYAPATDTWSEGSLPDAVKSSYASFNAFYDAQLNAYFVHAAGDSGDNGTMWAYRYKNVP
ncbi:MAG: hypothetical protein WKG00_05240 [Polyangiaceae bacterium]